MCFIELHCVALVALVVAVVALFTDRELERRRLRGFLRSLDPLSEEARPRALQVAGVLHRRARVDDPAYLGRLFRPLGSTPSAVIQRGGCCSGISRLYILCLAELGLAAHQITLYHRAGHTQHCLVEVLLNDGPLIVDPTYGFYYLDVSGAPVDLEALQGGLQPVFCSLPHSGKSSYPANAYYDFDFRLTKTANWTKSWPRRLTYRILHLCTGGGIDRMRLPVVLEWPQVLLAILLAGAFAAIYGALALLGFASRS